jgi:hypothetical protein
MKMEKAKFLGALRVRRFALTVLLTGISCVGVSAEENCNEFASALQSFIHKPTDEGLDNIAYLIEKPNAKTCDCSIDVLVYYNAWLKKVMPNSHALVGITPGEFVKKQESIMAAATKRLRTCRSANLRLLINALEQQDFDPDVAASVRGLDKNLGINVNQ